MTLQTDGNPNAIPPSQVAKLGRFADRLTAEERARVRRLLVGAAAAAGTNSETGEVLVRDASGNYFLVPRGTLA
jgi:hypothetical protein